MKKTICIDVETSSLPFIHPWQPEAFLVAVGIAGEAGSTKTWVFNHKEADNSIGQRQMIEEIQTEVNSAYRIVGHNLKFDLNWLRHIGVDYSKQLLYCTMVSDYLINGQAQIGYTLDAVAKRHNTVLKLDKVKIYWDAGYNTDEIPLNVLLPYLEQDCAITLSIFPKQVSKIQELKMGALVAIQNELQRLLTNIEYDGMTVSKETAISLHNELHSDLVAMDQRLVELFEFDINLNSGDELSVALFGGVLKRHGTEEVKKTLKNGTVKTYTRKAIIETPMKGAKFVPKPDWALKKAGYYSTDKGTIKQLICKSKRQKEIKKLLLERSAVSKACETFLGKSSTKGLINKLGPDGILHPQYNQAVSKTGRLTSRDPNGQNFPRKGTSPIKKIFVPRYDFILSADLSQLEWRCAGVLSQDSMIMREVLNGVDAHLDNAVKFFGDAEYRQDAKVFTFRMIYGGSAYSFFMDSKMPNFSMEKWTRIVDNFWKKYYGLNIFNNKNIALAYRNKGKLINPSGRVLTIPREYLSSKKEWGYAPQKIKNYPVQSFATADIMPLAMCDIAKQMRHYKIQSLMIAQVHDALVFDTKKGEARDLAELSVESFERLPKLIKKIWDYDFNLPLTGEIEWGYNYGEMKKLVL